MTIKNRVWIIGVKNGRTICGTTGAVPTEYKSRKKHLELASKLQRWEKFSEVYVLSDYYFMAHNGTGDEYQYVKTHGTRLI